MSIQTPGPWREPNDPAWLGSEPSSDETEANARLIAAAPELLEVLKELAALDFGAQIMNDDDTRRIDFVARRARAAIAKAEGKP